MQFLAVGSFVRVPGLASFARLSLITYLPIFVSPSLLEVLGEFFKDIYLRRSSLVDSDESSMREALLEELKRKEHNFSKQYSKTSSNKTDITNCAFLKTETSGDEGASR